MRKANKNLVPYAKDLRRNMTKEENHLWYDFLRDYPVRFLRQKVLGKYIVDFYCAKAGIVIELDGLHHYEDDHLLKDKERTEFLEGYDIKVIRILNRDINSNFNGVCEYIDAEIKKVLGDNFSDRLRR